MLGGRSDQKGLWEADWLYLDHVGRDTFYVLLASLVYRETRTRSRTNTSTTKGSNRIQQLLASPELLLGIPNGYTLNWYLSLSAPGGPKENS